MDFKQKLNEFDIKINDVQIKSFEKYMNLL